MTTTRRIRNAALALLAAGSVAGSVAALSGTAEAYTARITAKDLQDAGAGRSAGGGYILNGRLYDCSGTGYCTSVRA